VKRTKATSSTETTESAEEITSRLKKEERTHIFNMIREATLIVISLIFLGIIVYICFNFLMINPNATTDDKKWATAILFALASAIGGFLTGSKMPSAAEK
jgi:hypothetical protein